MRCRGARKFLIGTQPLPNSVCYIAQSQPPARWRLAYVGVLNVSSALPLASQVGSGKGVADFVQGKQIPHLPKRLFLISLSSAADCNVGRAASNSDPRCP